MVQNLNKFILFICMLSIILSCNKEKKTSNQFLNTNTSLTFETAISGWYKLPLELAMNTDSSIRIDTNLLKGYLLSTDSILMRSELKKMGDIKRWAKPKLKDIKTGITIVNKESSSQKNNTRIYFDQSKKIEDQAMVLSMVIAPKDLFDYETGIYTQGVYKNENNPKKGNYSQRGKKWKKIAYAHLFNTKGALIYKSTIGVKIHGNLSRAQPQKSFGLLLNAQFKSKMTKLNLFGEEKRYQELILRTPFTSSMQGQSILMDSYIGEIALKINLDAMASIPCNLYINGEYWGLYHLREKINEHSIAAKYLVSKKSISIVEFNRQSTGNYKACYGDKSEHDSLIDFLNTNQLSEIEIYKYLEKKVDLNNLIDYLIVSTFFGNKDWPANNYKFWKSKELDNKWRFIIHDMDACFRKDNMFEYLLAKNKNNGNNSQGSTILFKQLFKNQEFVTKYKARYKELEETLFNPSFLITKLNLMTARLEPSLPHQIDRWQMPETQKLWIRKIEEMREFLKSRPKAYNKHLKQL